MFKSANRLRRGAYRAVRSTVAMRPLGMPCTSSATNTPVWRLGLEPDPKASSAPAGQPGSGGRWTRLSKSGLAALRLAWSRGKSPSNRRSNVPNGCSAAPGAAGSLKMPRCSASSATTNRRWRTRTSPLAALRWGCPCGCCVGSICRVWRTWGASLLPVTRSVFVIYGMVQAAIGLTSPPHSTK